MSYFIEILRALVRLVYIIVILMMTFIGLLVVWLICLHS